MLAAYIIFVMVAPVSTFIYMIFAVAVYYMKSDISLSLVVCCKNYICKQASFARN